jgi:hypothetical protein
LSCFSRRVDNCTKNHESKLRRRNQGSSNKEELLVDFKENKFLCWDDDLLNHLKFFSDSSDLFGIAIDFLVFGIIEEFTERKICENSNPNNFRNSNSKPQITEKKIQFQVHQ